MISCQFPVTRRQLPSAESSWKLTTGDRKPDRSTVLTMFDLCFLSATQLAGRLRARELSASEVLEAHLRQIERVNPEVNTIVTLDEEAARARARELDDLSDKGGVLHGLPIAIKDLELTKGLRTTFGSPIYENNVPGPGRALRRAAPRGRRCRHRKNQHARIRRGLTNLQPCIRAHAEPLPISKNVRGQ